jgi:hypothetical protein
LPRSRELAVAGIAQDSSMKWVVLLSLVVAPVACSSADHAPRVYTRQATANDTPFGGGFPPSQRPDGDPFGRESRRTEIRFDTRGDNGAPETRVNTGGDTRVANPDARLYR